MIKLWHQRIYLGCWNYLNVEQVLKIRKESIKHLVNNIWERWDKWRRCGMRGGRWESLLNSWGSGRSVTSWSLTGKSWFGSGSGGCNGRLALNLTRKSWFCHELKSRGWNAGDVWLPHNATGDENRHSLSAVGLLSAWPLPSEGPTSKLTAAMPTTESACQAAGRRTRMRWHSLASLLGSLPQALHSLPLHLTGQNLVIFPSLLEAKCNIFAGHVAVLHKSGFFFLLSFFLTKVGRETGYWSPSRLCHGEAITEQAKHSQECQY